MSRDEDIKEAALGHFLTQGVRGTTVRDIAQTVGVTPGALYHHFASKDALLVTLVQPLLDGMEGLLEAGASRGNAREEKKELLTGYFDLLCGHLRVVRWLERDSAAQGHAEVAPILERQTARFRALLARPKRGAAALARAAAAVGAVRRPLLVLDTDLRVLREVAVSAGLAALESGGGAGTT